MKKSVRRSVKKRFAKRKDEKVSDQYDKNEPILKQSEVLVPLDGSAFAEAILPHALLFAPGCEAFIERMSGSGQGNVLVVVT
jgi:hypothetical protein